MPSQRLIDERRLVQWFDLWLNANDSRKALKYLWSCRDDEVELYAAIVEFSTGKSLASLQRLILERVSGL